MLTAGELSLNALADNDTRFYDYFSDGFAQMDLFATTNPKNQNFRAISNPSMQYGQGYDAFPNDRDFRLGHVTYDDSDLINGTGTATVTGITLGISGAPSNPSYLNWARFTTETIVDEFEGEVTLLNGIPVSATLAADVRLQMTGVYGATVMGEYPGTFSLSGKNFEFQADGSPVLDTAFGTEPIHFGWDFSGRVSAFAPDAGDYDGNGVADGNDFLVWQREFGNPAAPAGSGADGDNSGTIDAGDLVAWKDNFGFGTPIAASPAAAVPEPASIVSLVACFACCGFAARRRRN